MTNPYTLQYQLEQNKNQNPYTQAYLPHADKDYDSMPMAIGKEAILALVKPITGLARFAGSGGPALSPGWSAISDLGKSIETKLEPNIAPDTTPIPEHGPGAMMIKNKYGMGDFLTPHYSMPTQGEVRQGVLGAEGLGVGLVSGSMAFKGVGSTLDLAAAQLPSNVTSRAITSVAKISEMISKGAVKLGASEEVANAIGGTAFAAPRNIATGIATDVLTNPDHSVSSMATNATLAGAFSAMEGWGNRDIPKFMYPDLALNYKDFMGAPRAVGEALPDYISRVASKIGEPPEIRYKGWRDLTDAYSAIVKGTQKFAEYEKAIGGPIPFEDRVSAAADLASGKNGYYEAFLKQTYLLDDAGNMQPTPVPGHSVVLREINTPQKKALLDSYLLSQHFLDEAQMGAKRSIVTNDEGEQANVISTFQNRHVVDYPTHSSVFNSLDAAISDLQEKGYTNGYKALASHKAVKNPPASVNIADMVQTKALIESGQFPEIKKAADGIKAINAVVRQFGEKEGLINDRASRTFDILASNHVSLNEAMNGDLSGVKVQSPIKTSIDNAGMMLNAALKNRVKLKLADLADNNIADMKEGALSNDWIQKERTPDRTATPIWKTVNKVMDNLSKQGMDYKVDKEGVVNLVSSLGPDNVTPIDNNWSRMYLYRNGNIQSYKVNEDLRQALNSLNPTTQGLGMQILGFPARLLSIGTVENPAFGVVHAIRDSFDATLQSKYGFRLGYDSWRGFMEGIGRGEYKGNLNLERLGSGGGYGTFMDSRDLLNPDRAARTILPTTTGQKVISTITHPIEALQNMTRPFLEAARIGEYVRAREAGVSAAEAALHSRQFIGDFSMKGASPTIRQLSYATAFMNPGIQSMDALGKAMISNPKGFFFKGAATISSLTALNYAVNYGDEELKQLRQTPEGSTYWFWRLGDKIVKLPKPFAAGQIFGTGLETALDKVFGSNPDGGKQWAADMLKSSEIAVIPTGLAMIHEVFANKDLYSQRPIVPSNLQDINPQYQQTPNTSNLAKSITSTVLQGTGGKVNISPIMMDYIIKNSAGTLSRAATTASGTIGGQGRGMEDIPFLSRFMARYPTYSTRAIEDFYDKAKDVDQVVRTSQSLYRTNQGDDFTNFTLKNANAFALAPVYSETKAQLNELRTALTTLQYDKNVSADYKKEMANYIIRSMIQITESVNKGTAAYH